MRDGIHRSGLTLAATAVISLGIAAAAVSVPTTAKAQLIGPGGPGFPCGNECPTSPPSPPGPPPPPSPPGPPPPPAQPPTLPTASYSATASATISQSFGPNIQDDHHSFSGALPGSVGAVTFSEGQATASVNIEGRQIVQAEAHAAGNSNTDDSYGASAIGSMTYHLAIFGPESVLVPLHLIGSVGASASVSAQGANGFSEAGFGLSGWDTLLSGDVEAIRLCETGLETTCGTQSFAANFTLLSYSNPFDGHQGIITLFAQTEAGASRIAGGPPFSVGFAEIVAFADPYIEIDPDWAAAHPGYSLLMSDSVVNGDAPLGGGVPEPATWGLMIAGFGLAGAALRRRRVTVA